MPNYDYLPYAANSKITCPKCGEKKSFVRFFDTETGEVMPDEFGKCDHKNRCGYFNPPWQHIKREKKQPDIIERAPQKYIPKEVVIKSMEFNSQNNFLKLLKEKFGDVPVQSAIEKYFIGTSKTGGTGYYCIDKKRLVTSCKVVNYAGFNRNKHLLPYYPFKTTEGYYPCLFGLHLVEPDKKIKLVESEKTALIASIVYPEVVWLSCGGATNLTSAKCQGLKGYPHVIDLIPDCDQAGRSVMPKWQQNLSVYGVDSQVVDLGAEYVNSEDLADLLLL